MNKDNHLMFEAYASKFFRSEPFNSEDCEARAGEVDWKQKVQPNDHVEHGRRAAKWELESGKKATNPHQPNSDESREWEFGYKEEKGIHHDAEDAENFREQMPDSRENAENEYGVDPDEAAAYDDARKSIDFEHYAFWDAYHAVKEGAWTEEDFTQWARSVWSNGADEAGRLEHEDEEISEAKHSKKHVFTKVEKAAEKAGYSKKVAEKIAGAAKAKAKER